MESSPQPPAAAADNLGMPRRRIVLELADIDRARWEALADRRGVSLERMVRDVVDDAASQRITMPLPSRAGS